MKRRPVAVPLFTVDPYFSIWSCSDNLYNGYTKHWTEKPWPIYAGIHIDGDSHPVCGTTQNFMSLRKRITQTDLKIKPLSTEYTFENEIAKVKLTFTTPLLLDRPDIMSRPVSYMAYDVEVKKEGVQNVEFVFAISANGCVNLPEQNVVFKRTPFSMSCGNEIQTPLSVSGDRVTIDWGYLHLCDKDAHITKAPNMYRGIPVVTRSVDSRHIDEPYALNKAYNPLVDAPYMFVAKKKLQA